VVGSWVGPITGAFAPEDVSYATDRLMRILSRPVEQRERVSFSGMIIGRNAILAAELVLLDGTRLELLPVALPGRLATAVVRAEDAAARQIEGSTESVQVTGR
jgi:hypothetical protein